MWRRTEFGVGTKGWLGNGGGVAKGALIVTCLVCLAWMGSACVIQGTDSGECQDPGDFESNMPFCRDVVTYRACVPRLSTGANSTSTEEKDAWVQATHARIVADRISIENNDTLRQQGVNEHGIPGEVAERFTDNEDCVNAYRNFFCWLNFPRCDNEDRSLLLCRSVCENFFRACRYSEDMWRCYEPEYYGGEEAEQDEDVDEDGLPVFWRAQFPGQPFRDNEFDSDRNPIAVCTPSLLDGAPPSRPAFFRPPLALLLLLVPTFLVPTLR